MRIQLVSLAGDPRFSPPNLQHLACVFVSLSTCLSGWVLRQLGSPVPAESGGEAQNADRLVPPWGWKASLSL